MYTTIHMLCVCACMLVCILACVCVYVCMCACVSVCLGIVVWNVHVFDNAYIQYDIVEIACCQ